MSRRTSNAGRIVALIPSHGIERVARAASPGALTACSSPRGFAAALDTSPAIAVLDPSAIRDDVFRSLIATIIEIGIPVVLYGEASAGASFRVLETAARIPVEVVFQGSSDEATLLRRAISADGHPTVTGLLLHKLSNRLVRTPSQVPDRVIGVFGGLSAGQLSESLGIPANRDQSVSRVWAFNSGLESPSAIENCARVGRACDYLIASAKGVDAVAEQLVWSVRTMRAQFTRRLGLSPRQAASRLSVDEIAARLIASALAQPDMMD